MSTNYQHMEDVPTDTLAARLDELSDAISSRAKGNGDWTAEFTMRIPAEVDRDADLVMAEAARRLRAGQRAAVPEWPNGVLNRQTTMDVLTQHNEWRRGAETTQTDPRMLGLALDAVIAALAAAPTDAAQERDDA